MGVELNDGAPICGARRCVERFLSRFLGRTSPRGIQGGTWSMIWGGPFLVMSVPAEFAAAVMVRSLPFSLDRSFIGHPNTNENAIVHMMKICVVAEPSILISR